MYNLIYTSIEYGGSWERASGGLQDLIALAESDAEQPKYDSCFIENNKGQAVWEISLGMMEEEFAE